MSPTTYNVAEETKKVSMRHSADLSPQGYSNNFGESGVGTRKGVEGQIVSTTFKKMVLKFMAEKQMINRPENMSLHNDMRSFINYIKTNHGGIFRRVVMSGMLVSTKQMTHKVERKEVLR